MLSRLGACVLRCSPAPAPFSPVAAVLCPQGRFITTAAVTTHETQNVTRIERLMALSDKFFSQASTTHKLKRRVGPKGVFSPKQPVVKGMEELPPLSATRKMMDSFVSMDLKFSEDEELRAQYVGGRSQVRMGKLMEDFDYVAGQISIRHVLHLGQTADYLRRYGCFMVTASCDRLDMLRPLADPITGIVADLRLSGHVSYTSESSMEVFIRLSTLPSSSAEKSHTILLGRFAMACRSTKGGKFKIPSLEVEGGDEEALWQMGKDMRDGKKERMAVDKKTRPPTAEEAKVMHDLFVGRKEIFKRNTTPPADVIYMSDTHLSGAIMMHPAERNANNQVFGGYLMRVAYETAFATAYRFARQRVRFLALDELQFKSPVDIGDLLLLDSEVTFSPVSGEHRSFHVSVEAASMDLHTGETRVTDTFHYTFVCDEPLQHYVLPRSYRQTIQWLDAQRRRELGISIRKKYIVS